MTYFDFFYKNTLYKNNEAPLAKKIGARLEHAQLQMRNEKKNNNSVILEIQQCDFNKHSTT